jgi:hypothetical protein
MMRTWRVRPYITGDEEQLAGLSAEVFGHPRSTAQYRWKLLDAPWPINAPTVWLADAGDRIVGQYAGTPLRFKLQDRELTVVHSCDAMTAADYRRQGVLTAVGSAATEAWAAAGIPFLFGLPHAGWGSRRRYLGWRKMFEAHWLWRPLRFESLLARRFRFLGTQGEHGPIFRLAALAGRVWHNIWSIRLRRMARGVSVSRVERPGPEFDTLWQRLGTHYEALVVRDRAWVTYRYTEAPGYGYRLSLAWRGGVPAGYLAYRMTGDPAHRTGWILDLFTAPADAAARAGLLYAALGELRAGGAGSARVLLAAGTPLARELRRLGFLLGKGAYDVSIVPLAAGMPHPALSDPNCWFTMAGDYDVV